MDYVAEVRNVVTGIRRNSPIILMNDAVVIFKRMYSGPIRSVSSISEVRDLVANYYEIKHLDYPLIIEDLCLLSQSASFLLLKLVEEARFPIILLSTHDKVSPILLSRCKRIVKFTMTPISCQFMPPFRGKEAMDEYLSEDSDKMDQLRWMRDNSPMLAYYRSKFGNRPNIDKYLDILM